MNKKRVALFFAASILLLACGVCGGVSNPQTIIIVQATAIPTQTPIPPPTVVPTKINMGVLPENTLEFDCDGIKYSIIARGTISPSCPTQIINSPRVELENGATIYWRLQIGGFSHDTLSLLGPRISFDDDPFALNDPELSCFSGEIQLSGYFGGIRGVVKLPAEVHCTFNDIELHFTVPEQ